MSRSGLGVVAAVIGGAVFGLIIYYVDFYGFTALFPWFAMARGTISIFSHVMFGAVLGGAYRLIERRDQEREVAFVGARAA